MIGAFAAAYPDKNPTDLLNVDRVMRQPSKQLGKLHVQKGNAGTYLYEFTLEFPFMHDKIAWHCSDIPFFFHNTNRVEICGMPSVSDVFEEQIFGAFMVFVRNGQPDDEKLPAWPAVTNIEKGTHGIWENKRKESYF